MGLTWHVRGLRKGQGKAQLTLEDLLVQLLQLQIKTLNQGYEVIDLKLNRSDSSLTRNRKKVLVVGVDCLVTWEFVCFLVGLYLSCMLGTVITDGVPLLGSSALLHLLLQRRQKGTMSAWFSFGICLV